MEPIPLKKGNRAQDDPLRQPISSLSQWNALKAKDNKGRFLPAKIGRRQHLNPLLNPVADVNEWRALIAKDTDAEPLKLKVNEPLTKGMDFNFWELDEQVAVDVSLSCWVSPSQTPMKED